MRAPSVRDARLLAPGRVKTGGVDLVEADLLD
jgi:hypothetical protein